MLKAYLWTMFVIGVVGILIEIRKDVPDGSRYFGITVAMILNVWCGMLLYNSYVGR